MFDKMKNKIDKELGAFISNMDKNYSLSGLCPLLFDTIKDFILRKGKRLRPILFIAGYQGFCNKEAAYLYRSAISTELLHAFLLIHDDIIDKSDTRRGKPSMHKMLDTYLLSYKHNKFNGQDLAIVTADIIYAMAIEAFLSIKEDAGRKQAALKKLIEATIYTGSGEFIELLLGLKNLNNISNQDIYKVYDYKTAYYSFASPLSIGATLAGASKNQIDNLLKYGLYLGRAFQIKDDILGMFGEEAKTGKSSLTDLQEAKKTILIWYAYNNSGPKNKRIIEKTMSKKNITNADLTTMRRIITKSGALDYAKNQINDLITQTQKLISSCKMHSKYKQFLSDYSQKLLVL